MPTPSIPIASGALPVRQQNLMDFPADPLACMKSLHGEFGDLAVMEDNGQRLAFTFSPEYNREVLSDSQRFHSQFFAVRGGRRSAQRRVTSGLLSMNGAEHRENRRIMKEVFTKRVLPGYHHTITELTESMVGSWSVGEQHDLNTEMVHYMLKLTNALLFGIDDPEYSVELGNSIDRWVRQNHVVGMGALVASEEYTDQYSELLTMADELETSIHELFRRNRAQKSDRPDVLSLMFQAQASEQQLGDEKLVGHATLTFAAAHLTTAHTLSWTLFLLAQHPDVMQKLSEELAEQTTGDHPTYDELSQLTYLDWVIKESMRILPASSYSQRICAEPVQLGPLSLPKGTPVIFSQFITHHRSDLYEDPDSFRPDRWKDLSPSAYEYLPFGAGPRMCIGASLAMVELRTCLAIILKRFHFQVEENGTVDGRVVSTMLGPTTSVQAQTIAPTELPKSVAVAGTINDLVDLPVKSETMVRSKAA